MITIFRWRRHVLISYHIIISLTPTDVNGVFPVRWESELSHSDDEWRETSTVDRRRVVLIWAMRTLIVSTTPTRLKLYFFPAISSRLWQVSKKKNLSNFLIKFSTKNHALAARVSNGFLQFSPLGLPLRREVRVVRLSKHMCPTITSQYIKVIASQSLFLIDPLETRLEMCIYVRRSRRESRLL